MTGTRSIGVTAAAAPQEYSLPPDPIFFVSYPYMVGDEWVYPDPVVMFTGPQAAFNANTYAIAYPKSLQGDAALVWSIDGGTIDVQSTMDDARHPSQLTRPKVPKEPS
jgi:hypothetical protein